MDNAKLDPSLEAELSQTEARGAVDREIPVIIEHSEAAAPAGQEPDVSLDDLERRVQELQRGIMSRLSELGAGDSAQQLPLVNAVSADLTPPQIRELAERDDVKIIRLNRQQQVTA